jgi:hypothetical protein
MAPPQVTGRVGGGQGLARNGEEAEVVTEEVVVCRAMVAGQGCSDAISADQSWRHQSQRGMEVIDLKNIIKDSLESLNLEEYKKIEYF